MSTDPSTRFTASQALSHPWFSETCILTPTTPGGSSHVVTRKQTSDLRKMGNLSPSALCRSVIPKSESSSVQRTIDFYSQSPISSPSGKSRIKVLPSPGSPSVLSPQSSAKKRKLPLTRSPLKKSRSSIKGTSKKTSSKTDNFVQKKLTFDWIYKVLLNKQNTIKEYQKKHPPLLFDFLYF